MVRPRSAGLRPTADGAGLGGEARSDSGGRRRAGRIAGRALAVGLCTALGLGTPTVGTAAEAQRRGGDPPSPETVCRIDEPAVAEASGLVAGDGRWFVVNDGGTDVRVYSIDRSCRVLDVFTDSADPYDVEDLGRSADGTFWLADIGDNRSSRDTVALHAFNPGEGSTLYRLTYPDGAHDSEAVILDRQGTPHIITKSISGSSSVYRPAAELRSPGPTPLEKVGTVTVSPTATSGGPVGPAGSLLITGGASSHDGRVVALRTYTDAYLYPAPDGDVVDALQREPVRVPLPDEPQGEAIAFQRDGTLVSVSEGVGSPVRIVSGATALVTDSGTSSGDGSEGSVPKGGSGATAEDGTRRANEKPVANGRSQDDASGFPPMPAGAGVVVIAVVVIALAGLALVAVRRRR